MKQKPSGAEIRQNFIDFFIEHKHTFVPSMSLVPGGDATLLFTNAGMVQFKDIFLGTEKRPYTRATNSQKCMRVAGKHNDLEDVGQDDYHHTFFEMLGNWSFGDYYKNEAIAWAWQLLTDVWELPKEKLYATCFKDEHGIIPTDDEAAAVWKSQPGINPDHIVFFGRKENFWEMAETGPCGPCSEIHIDRGEEYDNLAGKPHQCGINGECQRYLELWNNVFIQYNRTDPNTLTPLPSMHVDTGMGFERIVAVLQGVDSNYKTDLFQELLETLRNLSGDTEETMYSNFTPYRVVADHARAATFLIADGVVPGNVGRNYVCRMIIRRAARFGQKIGLHEPFLSQAAEAVIHTYGDFYPELSRHRLAILEHMTKEEIRFAKTIESGTAQLMELIDQAEQQGKEIIDGKRAFDLYATYGLPLEIGRDIAREQGKDIDEAGFRIAMSSHKELSASGKTAGRVETKDVELYTNIIGDLIRGNKLGKGGVIYNPYSLAEREGDILSLVKDGQAIPEADAGDVVEVLLPETCFYTESGGQISDSGSIQSIILAPDGKPSWEIDVFEMRKPAPGAIVHRGEVVYGHPKIGDPALAVVDKEQRYGIMRNHTATHLLHAALKRVLGDSTRQAGSLVTANHLRFDFTHSEAMTSDQVTQVEKLVNEAVYSNLTVVPQEKNREEAIGEGAIALFGEKYGDRVRTITMTTDPNDLSSSKYSFELCGGTHLEHTSEIGIFLIVSESSAAAGIRRIEAVTGKGAYTLIMERFIELRKLSEILHVAVDGIPKRVETLQNEVIGLRKRVAGLKAEAARHNFVEKMSSSKKIKETNFLAIDIPGIGKDELASLADVYREEYPENGICIIASEIDGEVNIMATVTKDLIKRGIKAGELVGMVSRKLGAGGGGAPHLAFGGGKDISRLTEAYSEVADWLSSKLT